MASRRLALNPKFGTVPGITPEQQAQVEWTHWDDVVNVYGRDASGFARRTWDNVGVQYGLEALVDGHIAPAEFLDLNATIGGWKASKDMVQEGCPYVTSACPADIDVWSARNVNPVGRTASRRARKGASRRCGRPTAGLVFDGKIEIPVIDWRHYLDGELDMHNARQSFAARARLLAQDGDASNQVIWFTDARPARAFDQTPMALSVMDQWLGNIRAHPALGVAGNKPPDAVDRCFATNGTPIYAGSDAWNGSSTAARAAPALRCSRSTAPRTVAGGPFDEELYKCKLQPVAAAIGRGLYGSWHPSESERAWLEQIFPTGVCDYSKRDEGRPPGF